MRQSGRDRHTEQQKFWAVFSEAGYWWQRLPTLKEASLLCSKINPVKQTRSRCRQSPPPPQTASYFLSYFRFGFFAFLQDQQLVSFPNGAPRIHFCNKKSDKLWGPGRVTPSITMLPMVSLVAVLAGADSSCLHKVVVHRHGWRELA